MKAKRLLNNCHLVTKKQYFQRDTRTYSNMSSSNKQPQVIIDLNKILNLNDSTEVKRMEAEFELNGC
jgi:hypothetical protein